MAAAQDQHFAYAVLPACNMAGSVLPAMRWPFRAPRKPIATQIPLIGLMPKGSLIRPAFSFAQLSV
jgi:hypothetical protein